MKEKLKIFTEKYKKIKYNVFITDIILACIFMLVFAYFHHVKPRVYQVGSNAENEVLEEKKGNYLLPDWSNRFKEKFYNAPEVTKDSYKSANISIQVSEFKYNGSNIFMQDIYITDIRHLRAGLAENSFGRSVSDTVPNMAKENNAVAAINGDSYSLGEANAVIRNGVLYREETNCDVCVLYYDGTMKVIAKESFNAKVEMENGAWQAWSFGPGLLDENGEIITGTDSPVWKKNPRTAIGYYEPGHYCFVVVEGRRSYSPGLDLDEMSELFKYLGCKQAYNLDGGQTSYMMFMNKAVNTLIAGGRECSDIILITEEK